MRVHRHPVIGEQQLRCLMLIHGAAEDLDRGRAGLAGINLGAKDVAGTIIEELKDRGRTVIAEHPLGGIQLPALVDQLEAEPPPRGAGPFLRLRDHHPGIGEQPCQGRPGRGRQLLIEHSLTHAQRPMIPTLISELLTDPDRGLLHRSRRRQIRSLPPPASRAQTGLHRATRPASARIS